MKFDKARRLVLVEGLGEDGITAGVRMGAIPSSLRMASLLSALEIIFQHLRGHDRLDRELVHALFGLTLHLQGDIDGMIARGVSVPDTFIDTEMARMFLLAESILEDEWLLD